jgi:hypothetical protein
MFSSRCRNSNGISEYGVAIMLTPGAALKTVNLKVSFAQIVRMTE